MSKKYSHDLPAYLKPEETRFKADLHRKRGMPINWIANYLGFSYPYTCNLLNGYAPMTKEVEAKLEELVKKVSEGAN